MKESDGNVEMLVSLEINNFNGSHLEGTTAYKSDFFPSVKEQSVNKSVAVPQEKYNFIMLNKSRGLVNH